MNNDNEQTSAGFRERSSNNYNIPYSIPAERIVMTQQIDKRELLRALADCLSTIGGALSALAKVVRKFA